MSRGLSEHLLRRWPFAACALLAALLGCIEPQARLQKEDDGDREKYAVRTIRDVAQFDGTDPIPVAGVGLVTGLPDTGGDAPPGDYRTLLERQLAKQGVTNVKQVLARKDTSMVLVSALIPPAARKGDAIDIEITLPEGSKTTSLRGGYLERCELFNYDMIQRIAPTLGQDNTKAARGHVLALAEGALTVDIGDGASEKRARVWGGGRCKIDRPFNLVLNNDQQFAAVAKLVADRVNQTFHGATAGALGDVTAVAKNNQYVVLKVPPQYRLNLPRYMRVVGLIPLRAAEPGASASAVEAVQQYRHRLEEEVLDPARTVTAALRLESLGDQSRSALKRGLKSEHTLVRFACAEALAYMGDSAGGRELGQLVKDQPALRAFCLTALASLDEAVSQDTLAELLSVPNAETRYGAFRALRALNENEPLVKGERLGESFWLHKVAPGSPPLVHVSSSRRAEVVLFGDEPALRPPFAIQAGEFNVTAADDDTRCTIGRYSTLARTPLHRQCSLQLEDVLRTLASMGASYAEVVEVLRQAKSCACVSCPVEADALPQATSVYALKKAGERAKARAEGRPEDSDDEEILSARLELGATPTLFEKGNGRLRAADARPRKEKKTTENSEHSVE